MTDKMWKFIIIFIFLSTSLFGQNKYRFEYPIHLDFKDDIVIAKLDSLTADKNFVSINAKRPVDDILAFGTVTFQSKDTLITKLLDENGQLRVQLKNNAYTMQIQSLDSKSWTTKININNSGLNIDYTAARNAQLEGYIVKSKTKMNGKELNEIKKCLENSKDNKACEQKKKFIILIEI